MKTTGTFLLVIFAIISGAGSFAQTPVPGGPVSGTWTLAGSPYQVQGEISIATGSASDMVCLAPTPPGSAIAALLMEKLWEALTWIKPGALIMEAPFRPKPTAAR